MSPRLAGDELPRLVTDVPGPRSRALAQRLARVESRNITALQPPPICWIEARGAAVRDADDNIYVDLTAGFGVAHAGHAHPAVAAAVASQAALLAHGLGDVFPPEPRVRLLERLAQIAPGELGVSILASSGAEAVEAALKTAAIRTRRSGIIAFEDAYHGLTYGALATTWRADFRAPFERQLFAGVRFARFPDDDGAAAALDEVDRLIEAAERGPHPIGAILIEPVLGRGGLRPTGNGVLAELRRRCDGERMLLIFDEIYTGCGRTGRWFACEHEGVLPDVLVVGKALGGGLPIAAAIGTPRAMSGWPPSTGEAIHTSTFLGNPVACAAALAQIDAIEANDLIDAAERTGQQIRRRTSAWADRFPGIVPRGRGLLQGVALGDGDAALATARRCLEAGVLVLAEGPRSDVLALTPPAVITDAQLNAALATVEMALTASLNPATA